MPDTLWLIIAFIAVVCLATVFKVIGYMRQSDKQWQQVDKSKLKKWEDDDED